jgi:hypothetical protein
MLVAPNAVAAQNVICQPLSDEETLKFITERGQVRVRGSGEECKAGETLDSNPLSDHRSHGALRLRDSREGGEALLLALILRWTTSD